MVACTQPETMVSPEPIFDKFGDGSCIEGYTYIPGTVPGGECDPDDDRPDDRPDDPGDDDRPERPDFTLVAVPIDPQ